MSLVDTVRDVYQKGGTDAVWRWCMAPDGPCRKARRFAAAADWARKKRNKATGEDDKAVWEKRRKIYAKYREEYEAKCEAKNRASWPANLPVTELLWQVSGHFDHAHLASSNRDALIKVCRVARDHYGLFVLEFPPFDPVACVHVSGSWHYRDSSAPFTPRNCSNRGNGLAADISGSRTGEFVTEVRRRF